jgi:ATP-dependent protease ClpP protease subunit
MPNIKKPKKPGEISQAKKQITELGKMIEQKLNRYQEIKEGCLCFPFLGVEITNSVVDDIFQDLRTKYKECGGRLNVIIDSGGGSIDAAYNLVMLFRKFGTSELNFVIPRWAKSAATLLVCSGNKIFMSPVAELGPLDPQINNGI